MPIGLAMRRRSLREYLRHYHDKRNHQGLDNRLIIPMLARDRTSKRIRLKDRLRVCGGSCGKRCDKEPKLEEM
jgi:hypothetical protein